MKDDRTFRYWHNYVQSHAEMHAGSETGLDSWPIGCVTQLLLTFIRFA